MVTDCDSVSVWVVPYPSIHASHVPACVGSPDEPYCPMTPEDAAHTVLPDSKPRLPSFWPGLGQPPPVELIVQLNVALPEALVLSFAVTVELNVPAADGVPEMRPVEALIARPVGRPVALQVSARPPESVPLICRLFAVPTVPV